MDQATELRRAYATLGIGNDATLEEARAAYSTWAMLLSELAVAIDGHGTERGAERAAGSAAEPTEAHLPEQAIFARHELDLAWYAIEQAHIDGALFVRRARGCTECGRTPAVRVTYFSVRGTGLRTRRVAISALVCRECGLDACARVQRDNLRRGWWGLLAPFHTMRALTRNAAERRFIRRVEAPPRRRAPAPRPAEEDLYTLTRRRPGVRLLGWLTGLAAIAMTVGMAVPASSGDPQTPEQPTTAAR